MRSPSFTCYIDEWKELYLSQSMSPSQIAKRYNCSRPTVANALKKSGVQLRTHSESIPRNKCNEAYFDEINSDEKAYWLGFMAADGSISQNSCGNYGVSLTLSSKDRDHLEKFAAAIDYPHDLKKDRDAYKVSVTSNLLAKPLMDHGIVPNKTSKLQFPDNLDPKWYRSFIRGYFDGDGSVYGDRMNILGTNDFLHSLKEIFTKELSTGDVKILPVPGKNVWKLQYSGRRQIKRIADWMYSDSTIHLDRKYERFQQL